MTREQKLKQMRRCVAQLYRSRRAEGRCVYGCGPLADWSGWYCEACLARHREYDRNRRRKKRSG